MKGDGRDGSEDAAREVHDFRGAAQSAARAAESVRNLYEIGLAVRGEHRKDVLLDAVTLHHAHEGLGALTELGAAKFSHRRT